ncbi:MurR/RpiR family transcriptional regulator, partial [Enterococcus gallinarum]|nr:MurR/RpiR family transcriptional regulator [Enterococcus gallinarum]
MTIYELAEECFVSTAAISRFTRILAFSSYTEFKQAVEKEIDIVSDYSKKVIQPVEQWEEFLDEFTSNLLINLRYAK